MFNNFKVALFVFFISFSSSAFASSFDVIGNTYEIKEVSLLNVIMNRLSEMEENGDIDAMRNEMISNTKKYLERPRGISLPRAKENKTHYFDPTITLTQDIYLPDGRLLHKKGTMLNPLDVRGLSKQYIFIDGDDPEQVDYAYRLYKESNWLDRVVLLRGSVKEITKEWKRPVYFDQLGMPGQQKMTLREKFNIESLPTVVYQDGKLLRVDAVKIGD